MTHYGQSVAECVKHFESTAAAPESLDGFRYEKTLELFISIASGLSGLHHRLAHHFPASAILFRQVLFGGRVIENLHVLAVPLKGFARTISDVA